MRKRTLDELQKAPLPEALRNAEEELAEAKADQKAAEAEQEAAHEEVTRLRKEIDSLDSELRGVVRESANATADNLLTKIRSIPGADVSEQIEKYLNALAMGGVDPIWERELETVRGRASPEEWKHIEAAYMAELRANLISRIRVKGEALYPIAPDRLAHLQDDVAALEARHEAGAIDDATYQALRDRMSRGVVGWKSAFCGLADRWDDAALMAFGLQSWTAVREKYTKKHGETPDLQTMQDGIVLGTREIYQHANKSKREAAVTIALFAVTWAQHAFQKIVTSHTYAAALMCSDASREVLAEIEVPWLAFQIVIPNGILTYGKVDYTRALVTLLPDPVIGLDTEGEPADAAYSKAGATLVLYDPLAGASEDGRLVVHRHASLAELLFDEPEYVLIKDASAAAPPRSARCLALAKRLIAGLLLAMQHQDNFKTRSVSARHGLKKRDVGEPAHRITMIGKPLRIDCRDQVKKYLDAPKRHAPPSVQSLIRGHYKRQVIGVGRTGRKVIWIEPYWRGPEDAPILTKPRRVG